MNGGIAKLTNQNFNLIISDNGSGITDELRPSVFSKNFTTKSNGNGIGLSSIKENMKRSGGDLKLLDKNNSITEFCIELPIIQTKNKTIVFIDNDKYLRLAWSNAAKLSNCSLHVFSNYQDFNQVMMGFSKEALIFIDSELGNDLKGEELSRNIFDNGFKEIYLTTSRIDIDMAKYPWIKGKCPKIIPL